MYQAPQVIAGQLEGGHIGLGDHVGGSRSIGEQRHLPEV